jgi:tetratricopeptide (TPR) repeat protein
MSSTHYNLGRLLGETDPEAAERSLQRAIDLEPDNADYRVGLGTLYLRQGQMDRAMEEYAQAESLDPENHQSLLGIGLVHLYYNRLDDAIEKLERALESEPDFADTHFFLGFAYYSRGEVERAREEHAAAALLDRRYEGADYEAMLSPGLRE